MEILINLTGRAVRVGKRDIGNAVVKLGYIHLQVIERTVIVTMHPKVVSALTAAAAAYLVGDFYPERVVIIAIWARPRCWVFYNYLKALGKLTSLIGVSEEPAADWVELGYKLN